MTLYHVKKNVLPILVLIFFGECKKSFTPQENETILQSKSSNKLIQNISKWGVISKDRKSTL